MDTSGIDLRLADPASERAIELVHAMEDEIERTYADRSGSIHSVGASPEAMRQPAGAFILIYDGEREIGCGGLKRLDERTCEIKRMYVEPGYRGRGLSRRLLVALEDAARELGYSMARLDTGDRQPGAKHLYESSGYEPIDNYNGNTQARFWFEKRL